MSQSKIQILNVPLFGCYWFRKSLTIRWLLHFLNNVPFWNLATLCLQTNRPSPPSRRMEAEVQVSVSPHPIIGLWALFHEAFWVLLCLASLLWKNLVTRGGGPKGSVAIARSLGKRMIVGMTTLPSPSGEKGCHPGSSTQCKILM